MITTIYDNLDIDTQEAIDYLRANPEDEQTIEILLNGIKRKADNFIQREEEYFENENEEVVIPEDIKLWVLEMLGRKYNHRVNGMQSENVDGYGSITLDKEDYGELWQYRKLPGT